MTRLSKLLALLLALSLFAAACGDDDDDEGTETTETTEDGTETTDTTEEATTTTEAEETTATSAEETTTSEAMDEAGTIVDVATDAGDFTTLLAAADAAGLVETLSGPGPLTVFAPTDAAFEAALTDLGLTAEELLADTETLTSILTYHVVEGELLSSDLSDGQTLTTVNGEDLTVTVGDDDSVMINDATVAAADVEASNGVIHVIDMVLLPS